MYYKSVSAIAGGGKTAVLLNTFSKGLARCSGSNWVFFPDPNWLCAPGANTETGVKAGTEGTIVDVLGNGKAFTVEFFDEDGNTIEASLYTEYTPAQLQKVETALTLT